MLALGSLKDPVRPSPLRTSIRYGRTFPLLLFETCGCFRSTANFVHQTLSMMTALFPLLDSTIWQITTDAGNDRFFFLVTSAGRFVASNNECIACRLVEKAKWKNRKLQQQLYWDGKLTLRREKLWNKPRHLDVIRPRKQFTSRHVTDLTASPADLKKVYMTSCWCNQATSFRAITVHRLDPGHAFTTTKPRKYRTRLYGDYISNVPLLASTMDENLVLRSICWCRPP